MAHLDRSFKDELDKLLHTHSEVKGAYENELHALQVCRIFSLIFIVE